MAPAMLLAVPVALQVPSRTPPGPGFGVAAAVVGAAVLACVLIAVTTLALERRRRRAPVPLVQDEWHARRMMDELCPDGWSAHISMYPRGAVLPADAPLVDRPLVCLEWAELTIDDDGEERVVVARRMWATTLAAALDGMVADRRLDVTLEAIEREVAE